MFVCLPALALMEKQSAGSQSPVGFFGEEEDGEMEKGKGIVKINTADIKNVGIAGCFPSSRLQK